MQPTQAQVPIGTPPQPQPAPQQTPQQTPQQPQGQDPMAEIKALAQKMDIFGKLTIQAIMELEAAIEDRSGQKIEALHDELGKVQDQLSAIIEE